MFSQNNHFLPSQRSNSQHLKASFAFYAAVLLVLWVMVVAHFSKNLDFSDDSSRVRVEQARSANSDNDTNIDDFLTFDGIFQEELVFNFSAVSQFVLTSIDIVILRNLLIQIRPRSPPL